MLVETLELVVDGISGCFEALLGLANLIKLSLELLLALRVGRVLVVGAGEVLLLPSGILYIG